MYLSHTVSLHMYCSRDSNAIIMTFTSANVNTGRLKTFVDERLAAANLTVNTTGNQTVTITTTTAFSRFGEHLIQCMGSV